MKGETAQRTATPKVDSPRLMTQAQLARRWGVSEGHLVRMRRRHAIYEPDCRGLPGTGGRHVYHLVSKVEALELVIEGRKDAAQLFLEWDLARIEAELARRPAEQERAGTAKAFIPDGHAARRGGTKAVGSPGVAAPGARSGGRGCQ